MPKIKKTSSHMSEVLNKNKAQKPSGFTPSTFKLPGLFNRLFKKWKTQSTVMYLNFVFIILF